MSRRQTGIRRSPEADGSGLWPAAPWGVDLGSPPPNLPLPLTSFVGREEALAEVVRLVAAARLVTLVGPGGAGKTRLALAAARELAGEYGGAYWADLAPISDPELVAQGVARALGVREVPGRPPLASIAGSVGRERVLLFLDNCEHLVEACAALVEALLGACPNLRVVATSREILGVSGEHRFPVPPLSLPEAGVADSVRGLEGYEAVRLFVERARAAVDPGFRLTPENAPAISRICRRLDGIPLAIELAAAKTKVLSVEQISEKLDDRFKLLAAGARTALPRHKTLRATMDWSYALLSGDEKILLRRLSAFAGAFTLPAAEEVCSGADLERNDVLDVLGRLTDKSLVEKFEREGGEARYRLLETVRQYGLEKLGDAGEGDATRERHARLYLRLAEEAESKLTGAEGEAWLDKLEAELGNVAAALEWCSRSGGFGAEWGLRLAGALWRFCYLRGFYDEGRAWLEGALALGGVRQPSSQAKALTGAGVLALLQCDYERAEERLEESLAFHRCLGDEVGVASALQTLGSVARERGFYERAEAYHEESLALWRKVGDEYGVARSLNYLGFAAWLQGEHDRAAELCAEALRIFRRLRDAEGISWALISLGSSALYEGNLDRAEALLGESLAASRRAGYREGIAWSLNQLGVVAHRRGDYERAETSLRESFRIHRDLGDRWRAASVLESLAEAACERGRFERSARLFGAAKALRGSIAAPIPPCERPLYDRNVSAARSRLGELAFVRAWARGEMLTPEEAAGEEAAGEAPIEAQEEKAPPSSAAGLLSAREAEVLKLVAEGLTDAEVAGRLHLSPRTVGHHLRSIYRKLHVPSRTAAAKAARERRLI